MSFCEQKDVMRVGEEVLKDIFKACGYEVNTPFPVMTYKDATEFMEVINQILGMILKMVDVDDIFEKCSNEFLPKSQVIKNEDRIKALRVPNGDNIFSKRQMKGFEDFVRKFGASGLAFIQVKEDGLKVR